MNWDRWAKDLAWREVAHLPHDTLLVNINHPGLKWTYNYKFANVYTTSTKVEEQTRRSLWARLREIGRMGFEVKSHASSVGPELLTAQPLVTTERDFTAFFKVKQVSKRRGNRGRRYEGFSDLRLKLNWTGVEYVKVDVELLSYLEQSCAMNYAYLNQDSTINSAVQRLLAPIMATGDPRSPVVQAWFIHAGRKDAYRDWVRTQEGLHSGWMRGRREMKGDVVFINTFRHFACERMIAAYRLASMAPAKNVPSFQEGH